MLSKPCRNFLFLTLFFCLWSSFVSGQVRLVGSGSTQCSGRVEVQYNGTWGTVCDDGWDLNDANAVCRQLSCGAALQATASARFGEGSDPIWLDNVACSGSESSLTQCGHNGYGTHNCQHNEDAGVICSDRIRVAGSGSTRCSGRVEVKHEEVWGTVCNQLWDIKDVKVVCKQLSCGTALHPRGAASFGQGSGKIWLAGVECSGNENSLTDCDHRGYGGHKCDHSTDAGVICSESLVKPTISMDPPGEVDWGREVRITCSTAAELLGQTFILQKISDSFRHTRVSSSRTATFPIPKINFEHDGSYQCHYEKTVDGQNFTSPLSDPLSLRVTVSLKMPKISLTSPGVELVWGPGEADITRGHNFTFTCSITPESPQGQFYLIFSGDTKRKNSSVVINSATLSFPAAEFEHQGNYSCVYVVTSSSQRFTSPESAPITVAVRQSLLLILLISGGISLLLLFIVSLVCLVKRRKKLRNSMDLSHAEKAPRESGGDPEDDYENIQESCIPATFTKELQEEEEDDSNDYENAILDENIDYPETGSQYRRKCVSAHSQEEEMDEEDEETSDDDNDYENVTAHFNQSVEDEYIDPICDRSTDYPKFELKSQKEHRIRSKGQVVKIEKEDEDTSDDDNDYVNVTTLSTAV
ncbi:hypothetical protein OJAV_G00199950 [Oryzias javanicus]|uniref:SRCR domain-containing protein n=1 Tax=Oryzias javanicus TaxID=123683 RepID=A0A437C8B4_ORYJA|nr:hypothetical protein OJAV_G00199950 [Oryzias javanicus]